MSRINTIIPVRRLMEPDEAAMWLTKNPENRHMRAPWVKYLCTLIKRGEWACTTDAIGVDDRGFLRNGQHRLAAIVMADMACEVLFVEGLPEESFLVTDTGIKRSSADSLRIAPTLASDVTMVATLMGRMIGSRVPISDVSDILGWWSSRIDDFGVNVNRGGPGISNSSYRVAIILRSTMYSGEELEYLKVQAEALMTNNTQVMSRAVASSWQRSSKMNRMSSVGTQRLLRCAMVYHCLHPSRRDVAPLIKSEQAVLNEMKDALNALHSKAVLSAERETELGVTARVNAAAAGRPSGRRNAPSGRFHKPTAPLA